MGQIEFTIETPVSAQKILTAATDFSDRRPEFWPNIDPSVYRVHSLEAKSADVTEGSSAMGGIWAREIYDWSTPGIVSARVKDSNIFQPGGTWTMTVEAADGGGSRVHVVNDRNPRGFKGGCMKLMMSVVGKKLLKQMFEKTLSILSKTSPPT